MRVTIKSSRPRGTMGVMTNLTLKVSVVLVIWGWQVWYQNTSKLTMKRGTHRSISFRNKVQWLTRSNALDAYNTQFTQARLIRGEIGFAPMRAFTPENLIRIKYLIWIKLHTLIYGKNYEKLLAVSLRWWRFSPKTVVAPRLRCDGGISPTDS